YVMDGAWARSVAALMHEEGYLYTTEVAYTAELAGITPREVPVRLRRQEHRSRINPVRDEVRMAAGLARVRRRRHALTFALASVRQPMQQVTCETAADAGHELALSGSDVA